MTETSAFAPEPADPASASRSGASSVRVVLVDDQRLVRMGIRMILETEPGVEVVGEAGDGLEAIELVRAVAPDVVCMDVQMPRLDGLEATRRLCGDPAVAARVLMLTTFRDDAYVRDSLRAGASGFVLKNSPPETLVEAIRTVAAGDALLDPQVTRSVIEQLARMPDARDDAASAALPGSGIGPFGLAGADAGFGAPGSSTGGAAAVSGRAGAAADPFAATPELASLTEREREVLPLLAEGLSNSAIAKRLWVSDATIKTHVSNVLAKLGVRDRIHAVIYAYEHGVARPGD